MKHVFPVLVITLLISTSCDNSRAHSSESKETPKALKEKSASYSLEYKRGYGDLVEELYKEQVAKDPRLQELETKMDRLNIKGNDSTETYNSFNSKNQQYYSAASKHAAHLTDSLLKKRMEELIATSQAKFQLSTAPHKAILDSIEVKNATLQDLHTILKITKTLPLIETYQRESLPSTKPLMGLERQYNEAIRFADTLTKK